MAGEKKQSGLFTMEYLLKHIDTFAWDHWARFRDEEVTASSPVYVHDAMELDDPETLPAQAQSLDLRHGLSVQEIQDIVQNAEDQLGSPLLSELLEAVNYYCNHDAFIEFQR